MNKYKLTFLITTYNSEETIDKCLNSILSTPFCNYEILVVDDGSTDRTRDILNQYRDKNKNLKIIFQINKGVSEARNTGIKHANGDRIMFIDSDDEVLFTSNVLKIINESQADLLAFQATYIKKDQTVASNFPIRNMVFNNKSDRHKYIIEEYLKGSLGNTLWNKIFDKEIIINNKLRFTPGVSVAEDFVFTAAYLLHCNKISTHSEFIYKYYIRENTLTSKYYSRPYITEMFDHYFYMWSEKIFEHDQWNSNIIPFLLFEHGLQSYRNQNHLSSYQQLRKDLIKIITNDVTISVLKSFINNSKFLMKDIDQEIYWDKKDLAIYILDGNYNSYKWRCRIHSRISRIKKRLLTKG